MVDHADKLLCVWDGIGGGGTFLTRNYALQQGKEIIDYCNSMLEKHRKYIVLNGIDMNEITDFIYE